MPEEKPQTEIRQPNRNPSLREISSDTRRELERRLHSGNEEDRRYAIWWLSSLHDAPIPGIPCWPEKKCTDLQFAATEAILGEWFEYTQDHADASEETIIRDLFPRDDDPIVRPRVRRLAKPKPQLTGPLVKTLDAWSEKVKQVLLNWDVCPEPSELAGSDGQDCPLPPMDMEIFRQSTWAMLAETWQRVAEILAKARTDYELVAAEQSLHAVLATLRWEAIAVALELRDPEGERWTSQEVREIASSIERSSQPAAPEAKPTGDWVGKYRRMRAAGI